MRAGILKMRSLVLESWRVSPLMVSSMSRAWGSGTSSAVVMAGPTGVKVGKDLPSVHWEVASWMSRALTSLTMV